MLKFSCCVRVSLLCRADVMAFLLSFLCLAFYHALSVCPSVRLSVRLSVYLSARLSDCLCVCLVLSCLVCLSVCLSVCLYYLSVCVLSVCLSVCLSVFASLSLSLSALTTNSQLQVVLGGHRLLPVVPRDFPLGDSSGGHDGPQHRRARGGLPEPAGGRHHHRGRILHLQPHCKHASVF